MNEQELETLIVRLLGDSTSVDEMLKRVAANTASAADQMAKAMQRGEQVTRSVETATEQYQRTIGNLGDLLNKGAISQQTYIRAVDQARNSLKQSGEEASSTRVSFQNLATAATSLAAAIGAEEILRRAFNEYSQLEAVNIRLTNTMRANGEQVHAGMQSYRDFAQEIQNTTTISNTATLSLIQQAEAMGKTGEEAKKLAQDSIAFGAATGRGAEGGFHLALALQMGNVQMLRYGLGLRGVHNEAQILQIAHLRLLAGMNIAEEQAQTASGRLIQLSNSYKQLQQQIGEVVAKAIKPLVEMLISMIDWFNNLGGPMKAVIVTAGVLAVGAVALTAALLAQTFVAQQLTVAWTALDAAILANPIGLALAATIAAGIGIYTVVQAFNDTGDAIDKAGERLDAYKDKLNSIVSEDVKIYDDLVKKAPIQDLNKGKDRENYFMSTRVAAESRENELKKELQKAKDQLASMENENRDVLFGGGRYPLTDQKFTKEQLDQQRAMIAATSERAKVAHDAAEKMKEEAKKASDPNIAAQDEIKKLRDEYIKLGEEAGNAGTARKIAPLEIQGVTADQLDPIKKLAAEAAMKKSTAAQKEEADQIGMTATQIQAYNMVHQEYVSEKDAEIFKLGAVTNAVNKQIQSLKDEATTTLLSKDAQELYKLRLDNANAAQVEAVAAQQKATAAAQEQGKKLNELDDLYQSTTKSLQEYIETQDMTEAQKEAYKVKELGADQEGIDMARKIADAKDTKKILDDLMTPQEKFNKAMERPRQLFEANKIGAAAFNLEMQKIAKETINASNAIKTMQMVKQSAYGSAEAQQKVEDYKSKVLGINDSNNPAKRMVAEQQRSNKTLDGLLKEMQDFNSRHKDTRRNEGIKVSIANLGGT